MSDADNLKDQEQDQDFDADLEAGFASAESPTTTPGEEPTQTEGEPSEASQPQAVEPEPPKLAQITEDQLNSLLAKAAEVDQTRAELKRVSDQVFGHVGSLKQRLDNLQAATPAGQAIEVSDEDFAELVEGFPDASKDIIAGIRRVIGKLKGTGGAAPAIDPAEFDRRLEERLAGKTEEIRQQITNDTLNTVLRNWKAEVKTPEFNEWYAAQPDEVKTLSSSESVGDAAEMLRMYAEHKKAKSKPVANPQVNQKKSARQEVLRAAVSPKGTTAGVPAGSTEDDEFEAGFAGR